MHVLVTGGAGFIGTNFVRMAVNGELSGISQVTVLDKLTYAGVKANLDSFINSPGFTFVKGDICDPVVVGSILNEVDSVINFAAESHVDRSIENSVDFVNTNIVGVQVLLDALRKSDKKKRFIQVSTDEVYGSIKTGSWDESSPMKPNSPYSASKAAADHVVRAWTRTYGLKATISNCSNNYGPYQFPEKLIPLFLINALHGRALPIYGDGMQIRDWLHVEDHCRGIEACLSRGKIGETYNIGGGAELPNLQVIDTLCAAVDAAFASDADLAARFPAAPAAQGRPTNSLKSFVTDRPGHDRRYAIDETKARTELGYAPARTFEQGFAETLGWYLANEPWWRSIMDGSYRDWVDANYAARG